MTNSPNTWKNITQNSFSQLPNQPLFLQQTMHKIHRHQARQKLKKDITLNIFYIFSAFLAFKIILITLPYFKIAFSFLSILLPFFQNLFHQIPTNAYYIITALSTIIMITYYFYQNPQTE